MPSYQFKREAQVFVVHGGLRYRIDVSDVSFGQTFSAETYPVKTLHAQNNVFDNSVINKANAAKFSFTMPAITESDFTVVRDRLLDATSFDLFIKTPADTFKLETAVITNGSFVIEKSRPLSIQISGDASKLTRGQTLTGTLQNRSATMSYTVPKLAITVGGTSLSNDIVGVNLELQNEIKWTPYTTVHASLSVTNAANTMYPSAFTLSKKILSGSITQYVHDSNAANALTWDTNASLSIDAGNGLSGSSFRGFKFGPATCSFTNRVSTGTVFTQNYDWRMVENPTQLSSKINYVTD